MAANHSGSRPDQPRPLPLDAPQGGLKRGFAALGIRNYRLYWLGQVVSLIGTWMQQVSLPWLVLALGGSPIQLGFVAVLQFGPAMVLAPFGGVVADRIDKRHALMANGVLPDVLVMTATPIPRNLAMTMYGDLEVSLIYELQPGRTPITTRVFSERARPRVYEVIA